MHQPTEQQQTNTVPAEYVHQGTVVKSKSMTPEQRIEVLVVIASQYRDAAYGWQALAHREAKRFWISVGLNVVMLGVVWFAL